jgi:hypothetical protein
MRSPNQVEETRTAKFTSKAVLTGALLIVLVYAILAGADLAMNVPQGAAQCALKFPKWLGCVVANHENLAGGLIGGAGTLFAGWLAWTAVSLQIAENQRQQEADRREVEEVLVGDVDNIADAIGAVWKVLETIDENDTEEQAAAKLAAVTQGIGYATGGAWINTSREMIQALGWRRRREYTGLFDALEALGNFTNPVVSDVGSIVYAVRLAASYCQSISPDTDCYFENRFWGSAKAWSWGYSVLVTAGMDETGEPEDERTT